MVVVIAQTSDGFIWLGATTGLIRFDGVRFENFETIAGESLPSQETLSLHATRERGLWVGLNAGGTAFVRDGRVEHVDEAEGWFSVSTRRFVTDRDGTARVCTGRALLRRAGAEWIPFVPRTGLAPRGARPSLSRTCAWIQTVIDDADAMWTEGRNRVRDLRLPPPEAGQVERTLQTLGDEMAQCHEASFYLSVQGAPRALKPLISAELCLIAREAIFNAFQHARASRIDVRIGYGEEAFSIEVQDDGVGVAAEVREQGSRPGHWGLSGMRQRAHQAGARYQLASQPQGGTQVTLSVPAQAAYPERGRRTERRTLRTWLGLGAAAWDAQ